MMEKQPCVYMLASCVNGTLYIGVTSDLISRVYQHRQNLIPGFTQRYGVHHLVWYEIHQKMESAILREKQLKKMVASGKKTIDRIAKPALERFMARFGMIIHEFWIPAIPAGMTLWYHCKSHFARLFRHRFVGLSGVTGSSAFAK